MMMMQVNLTRNESAEYNSSTTSFTLPSSCHLLKHYYDHETGDRLTALHCLCKTTAHLEYTRSMIERYANSDLVNCRTVIGGDTALHFAVAAHDFEKVQLLLRGNPALASVRSNAKGNFGNKVTPIQVALQTKAPAAIVHALLMAKKNNNNANKNNNNDYTGKHSQRKLEQQVKQQKPRHKSLILDRIRKITRRRVASFHDFTATK